MSDNVSIVVDRVSKSFKLPHEKRTSIKSLFVNMFRGKRTYEKQRVINDISFEIKKGEFFGIVGRNGSGKSTLLKMLAGVYYPEAGNIDIRGKLTPFIELGVGFNPELSGKENVFLNGALLGFSRKEMLAMYDEIVDFAELNNFMDQKLKNYSSGMQVRLAFSIAIRARSDILLLDEVLAVGDAIFQKKCYNYFKQLKKDKRTVVFVSHDTSALQEYCDAGILIENGNVVAGGKIDTVVKEYLQILNQREEKEARTQPEKEKRWGTGLMVVEGVSVSPQATNRPKKVYTDAEEHICINVDFIAKRNLETPVYGITITDPEGVIVFQSNTLWCGVKTSNVKKDQKISVSWTIPNAFNTGSFTISPAVADEFGSVIYDWYEDASRFDVRKRQKSHAYINAIHTITIEQD